VGNSAHSDHQSPTVSWQLKHAGAAEGDANLLCFTAAKKMGSKENGRLSKD
jgi:hypothetical protein